MKKIIHYCWFGKKPLPKLAKKCIKSWKKFLPDYELKRWDETNFDVNITNFSKEAYKCKKWAFVADVARIYALKKHGGIYFDTDMLIIKKIDFLLNHGFFVGWESDDYVACGIIGVKNKNNPIIIDIFNIYKDLSFDEDNMFSFSIPKVLTKLLKEKYDLKNDFSKNQKLNNDIYIYTRDYFYPLSYNYRNNMFTINTCMIHYFSASWVTKKEQIELKIYRFFGEKTGGKIVKLLKRNKTLCIKIIKLIFFPFALIRRKFVNVKNQKQLYKRAVENLNNISNKDYMVIYNPEWLGTSYATKELFDNILPIGEMYSLKIIKMIANIICQKKFKTIIFSAFAIGWDKLANEIKQINSNITIKIIWHGSNSLHFEDYDWNRFKEIIDLYNKGVLNCLGFAKKSMAEFYKLKGYKTEFVANNVCFDKEIIKVQKSINNIKIGIYASSDRWVKNFYNQLSAASLVSNVIVECIPLNDKIYDFAKIINLTVIGDNRTIPRKELFKKMRENDVNLYVTFTECAPMLPLESFELGVPCITSNNHHYWEDSELKKYIIVEENDNVLSIYEKIKYCLENREKVLTLYNDWKKKYDIMVKKKRKEFIYKNE